MIQSTGSRAQNDARSLLRASRHGVLSDLAHSLLKSDRLNAAMAVLRARGDAPRGSEARECLRVIERVFGTAVRRHTDIRGDQHLVRSQLFAVPVIGRAETLRDPKTLNWMSVLTDRAGLVSGDSHVEALGILPHEAWFCADMAALKRLSGGAALSSCFGGANWGPTGQSDMVGVAVFRRNTDPRLTDELGLAADPLDVILEGFHEDDDASAALLAWKALLKAETPRGLDFVGSPSLFSHACAATAAELTVMDARDRLLEEFDMHPTPGLRGMFSISFEEDGSTLVSWSGAGISPLPPVSIPAGLTAGRRGDYVRCLRRIDRVQVHNV